MNKVLVMFVLALTALSTTAAMAQGAGAGQPGQSQPAQNQPGQGQPGNKEIKDPAEYNAYIAALNSTDPAQKAAALAAFLNQYPQTVVKSDALEQEMAAYQAANNPAKVKETARTILQENPNHVRARAIATAFERVAATGGDKQALTEAC